MKKIKSFDLDEITQDVRRVTPYGLLILTAIIDNILQPLVDHFETDIKVIDFHKVVRGDELCNSVEIKFGHNKCKRLDRRVTNFEIVQFLIKNDIFDQLELIGGTKKEPDSIRISHRSLTSNRKEMIFTTKANGSKVITKQERRNFLLVR